MQKVHHVSPCLIIGHHGYRQPCSCKNVETLTKKQPFLLQIATSHRSVSKILTSLLPPIQSCSSKFWAWSCIASNFDKGCRGGASTRSWTGHLSQNTAQCLKHFSTGCSSVTTRTNSWYVTILPWNTHHLIQWRDKNDVRRYLWKAAPI